MNQAGVINIGLPRQYSSSVLAYAKLCIVQVIALLLFFFEAASIALLIFGLFTLLAVITAVREYRRSNDLLHPAIWFLPALLLVTSAAIPATEWFGPPVWYRDLVTFRYGQYRLLLEVIFAGYLGFEAGGFVSRQIVRRRRSARPPIHAFEESIGGRRIVAQILMVMATVLLWYGIYQRGFDSLVGAYGAGQFDYDGGYYLRQTAQLVWFPAFALFCAVEFSSGRPRRLAIALNLLAFVTPSVVSGARASLVYALILLVVPLYIRRREHPLFRVPVLLPILLATITSWGLISQWRLTRSLVFREWEGLTLNPIAILFRTAAETGGVIAATTELVPESAEFYFGETIVHSFANLIPGVAFAGSRPFINPSLEFHQLFRPDVTFHGFGFSILAEGYMNFGVIGPFVFVIVLSILVHIVHTLLRSRENAFRIAFTGILVFQTLWFIRSDSTTFIKSLIYGVVVLALIEIVSSAVASGRTRKVTTRSPRTLST